LAARLACIEEPHNLVSNYNFTELNKPKKVTVFVRIQRYLHNSIYL
jgi:hypothetical protein